MERTIQVVKADLRQRISRCPETLFMADYCLNEALNNLARDPNMKTFDEWCPAYR